VLAAFITALMIEVASTSETSINFYQTIIKFSHATSRVKWLKSEKKNRLHGATTRKTA
jgi:hypothetical protein